MKLYTSIGPNPRVVRMFMAEKGIDGLIAGRPIIVSDKLISLVLSQVSENKKLTEVFTGLFSSAGSEIYLRPADWYAAPGDAVSYATMVAGARARGETAIGFKSGSDVVVNPDKSRTFALGPDDRVVVLAES